MAEPSVQERVVGYIAPNLNGHELRPDEDIFALGFVNSLFMMQLVLFVESEFGVQMENEDLEFDNFRTVEAIGALVESKLAARPSAQ